jgi:hypothetical protein
MLSNVDIADPCDCCIPNDESSIGVAVMKGARRYKQSTKNGFSLVAAIPP